MTKAKKKAAKNRQDHYEPKVKTDLSFDELIAMSVNNWDKQTGHRIKNPETSIDNSVKPPKKKAAKKK